MIKRSSLPPNGTSATVPAKFGRGNLLVCRRGRKGNVVVAALHRPDTHNAFHDAMYEDLIELLQLSARDDSVAALVLSGTGPYFSSGADLKADGGLAAAVKESEESIGGREMLRKPAGRFMMALIAFPKVIAAAVQGPAVGIGVTLLLHCDLVHMSPQANLWVPFTRLALVPELCSSRTFVDSMGLSKANELLLLGKRIDAQTSLAWNIASRVVDVTKGDSSSNIAAATTDPFHPNSLASRMVNDIDRKLLQLPCGERTSQYFVSLMRGSRRQEMERVCREELIKLDERFNTGQVKIAAQQVQFGSASKGKTQPRRSKL